MFLKDFKIMNGYWISPNPFFKSFGMIMYYPVILLIWSITFTGFLPWPHPIIALRMLPSPSFWPPEWGELTNRPSPPRGHHTRNKRPLCFFFFFYWTQIIFFINLDTRFDNTENKNISLTRLCWLVKSSSHTEKGKLSYSSRWWRRTSTAWKRDCK